jgi:hypothetical protein
MREVPWEASVLVLLALGLQDILEISQSAVVALGREFDGAATLGKRAIEILPSRPRSPPIATIDRARSCSSRAERVTGAALGEISASGSSLGCAHVHVRKRGTEDDDFLYPRPLHARECCFDIEITGDRALDDRT